MWNVFIKVPILFSKDIVCNRLPAKTRYFVWEATWGRTLLVYLGALFLIYLFLFAYKKKYHNEILLYSIKLYFSFKICFIILFDGI